MQKISIKKLIAIFVVLLQLLSLFSGCSVNDADPQPEQLVPMDPAEQMTLNLQRLCLVWGYTKYTHPVFISGEKDWDAELLALIPVIRAAASAQEANAILHEWFVGLGESNYFKDYVDRIWENTPDENKLILSDTSWITKEYLGEALYNDLSPLGLVPPVSRINAPVKFNELGLSDYTNEKSYAAMDYSDEGYRLLGLFRLWNTIEYYYPYLDILDDDWHDMALEYIPHMLANNDKHSYELTLAELSSKLHDCHVKLSGFVYIDEFGAYHVPVKAVRAEEQIVVKRVSTNYKDVCPLMPGDVLLSVDGVEVNEALAQIGRYVSFPTDEKALIFGDIALLLSHDDEVAFTIERDGQPRELTVQAYIVSNETIDLIAPTASHVLMEGNIGLINPAALKEDELSVIMDAFTNTNGLIVDLRQYPASNIAYSLANYLHEGKLFARICLPSQAMPGAFIRNKPYYSGKEGPMYDKPVVVLMNEYSGSFSEFSIMSLRGGPNVTVMGSSSTGADGNIVFLPLPGGIKMTYTGVGIFTPDGGQTQRVGLTPDINVKPTIKGIREGRDELMEAAVAYILNNQ